jgi:glycosyltransferase involved in cell wall biosynthesis
VEPAVAVVVATRNRARLLPRLVRALAGQDLVAPFELVVVDDGSTDDTATVLAGLAGGDHRICVERLSRSHGPAAARNVGWRRASATLVAFTDDDCVPHAGWLRALTAGAASADIVQGRTAPDPEQLARFGPFSHTISVDSESGHYETCNVAYSRLWLEKLGGFDESFRWPMGEDVDLGLRARALGARTTFRSDALVHHDVSPSSFRRFLRLRRQREGFARACKLHPELRAELSMGVFTHPNALATALAVASLARRPRDRRRRLVALLLLARYTRKTMRETPAPAAASQWAAVVPLRLAADLYEVGVMARASLRLRTLVL